MTIYIETFLIQNLCINLCLLKLIHLSLRNHSSLFRMTLSALLGAIISVIASIVLLNSTLINLIKILCAIAMLLIAFKQNAKQLALSFILLFVYTFAFGGLIMNFTTETISTEFGFVAKSNASLELICILIFGSTLIFERIVKLLKLKIKTNNLIYKVTLYFNNKKLHLNAYLDTGNFLNIDGNPILIADMYTYKKLMNKSLLDFYLEKSETIRTSTVSGNTNLKLIKIEKLELKIGNEIKTFSSQYIAINSSNIFKNTNYQALLTPLFL